MTRRRMLILVAALSILLSSVVVAAASVLSFRIEGGTHATGVEMDNFQAWDDVVDCAPNKKMNITLAVVSNVLVRFSHARWTITPTQYGRSFDDSGEFRFVRDSGGRHYYEATTEVDCDSVIEVYSGSSKAWGDEWPKFSWSVGFYPFIAEGEALVHVRVYLPTQ